MHIEDYAQNSPQYYSGELPALLEKYLKHDSGGTLLECGCGDGTILHALKERGYFTGREINAVDLSNQRINLVKNIDQLIKARIDNAEVLSTVADESIDFAISTQVIEHVDDEKMSSALVRVIKTGGFLYLTTVFKKKYGWYFYKNEKGEWALDPTHLREYQSDNELLRYFPAEQFIVLENVKKMQYYPLIDFFIKRFNIRDRNFFQNNLMRFLRMIKLPIIGYYKWELVLKKK